MRAFVDRIESGIATVLLGEQEEVSVRVPIALLPEHVREGTVLRIICAIDITATKIAKERIQALRDALPNEP